MALSCWLHLNHPGAVFCCHHLKAWLHCSINQDQGREDSCSRSTGFIEDPGTDPGRRGAAWAGVLPELVFVFFVPKILAAVTKGSRQTPCLSPADLAPLLSL